MTIFRLLLALVLLAPLAIGAVYPWAWGLMAACVGALLVAWGVRVVTGRDGVAVPVGRIWWAAVPFALVAIYGVAQASSLTPVTLHHPLWRISAEALRTAYVGHISVNPSSTMDGLVRLLAYAGIFWLALQYGRRGKLAHQAIHAVAIGIGLYAAYGLIVEFAGLETILWFRKTAYVDDLTGTFVNRNSFATFVGLGLVCATGLLVQEIHNAVDGIESGREKRRRLVLHVTTRGWLPLAVWALLIVALLLTHSRAGFLSTVLGLIVLVLAIGASRIFSLRVTWLLAGGAVVAGILFFTLSGEITARRLERSGLEAESRLQVYDLTLAAIRDAPLVGTGLGTFEQVFRFYRTEDINAIYHLAHNTYLENALELGIPAAAGLALAVMGPALLCAVGVRRRRRDAVYPCVGLATTALVAAHSLVDFSLQIPAVTAVYMLILGTASAQSWSSREQIAG